MNKTPLRDRIIKVRIPTAPAPWLATLPRRWPARIIGGSPV